MRQSLTFHSLCFLILISLATFGQSTDTTQLANGNVKTDTLTASNNQQLSAEDNDFSPMLAAFALFGFALILFSIGAGFAFAIIVLLAVIALISLGTLSASIIVGVHKKSLTKAFKTFVILSSTIGGTLSCMSFFRLINLVPSGYMPELIYCFQYSKERFHLQYHD